MSKNLIKKLAISTGAIAAFNKIIDIHTNNLAKSLDESGSFYEWKYGKIYYKVKGTGKPLLLIHSLDTRVSSYEWDDMVLHLSRTNRVYILDLPGCGRSDKPDFVYTSYLYVQFIKEFVQEVIKGQPNVIVSENSVPFIIMANKIYDDLFAKIILLNPPYAREYKNHTDIFRKAYMKVLFTPILGTGVYNLTNLSSMIFLMETFNIALDENLIAESKNAYIASHLGKSHGKYLQASLINNYLNVNFLKQLKSSDNISIIISSSYKNCKNIIHSYITRNPSMKIKKIDSKSPHPHREVPGKVITTIKGLLN